MASIIAGSIEALMLIAVPYSSSGTRWPDVASYLSYIGDSAVVAVPMALGTCAAPIAFLSLFIYWISDDESPILRSILLAPLPLFFPAIIWGVCHALSVIGTSTVRGSPGWANFPLFGALGAIGLLPLFAIVAYGMILWSARVSMRLKLDPTLCRACAYSLRGLTSTQCPECGTAFDPERIAALIKCARD